MAISKAEPISTEGMVNFFQGECLALLQLQLLWLINKG